MACRASSPRRAASARRGARSSTAVASFTRTSSHARWRRSSSTTTRWPSQSSSPPLLHAGSRRPLHAQRPRPGPLQRRPPPLPRPAQPRRAVVGAPAGTPGLAFHQQHVAVSPHCEVLLIPSVPRCCNRPWARRDQVVQHVEISAALLESEWPPSPCVMNVFLTGTGRWTERSFRREGEAAGTVAGMRKGGPWLDRRQAVYWRGALYAHCEMDFVMR